MTLVVAPIGMKSRLNLSGETSWDSSTSSKMLGGVADDVACGVGAEEELSSVLPRRKSIDRVLSR